MEDLRLGWIDGLGLQTTEGLTRLSIDEGKILLLHGVKVEDIIICVAPKRYHVFTIGMCFMDAEGVPAVCNARSERLVPRCRS